MNGHFREMPNSMYFFVLSIGREMPESMHFYRVADPSCHPQISLCARIQNKTESWTDHPLKWLSPELATPKKWQSPGLATPKLTRFVDSAIFWGWQVLDFVISEGGQFWTLFFFWILAHREIWGWQEGSATLYVLRSGRLFIQTVCSLGISSRSQFSCYCSITCLSTVFTVLMYIWVLYSVQICSVSTWL